MIFNDTAKKLFNDRKWSIATCGESPDVATVAFKTITDDGLMLVGDVFLNETIKNIKANGKVTVTVFDNDSLLGYKVKGEAVYLEEGDIVNTFKNIVEGAFNGAFTAKGAIVITPRKLIDTTPGPNSGKEVR